MSWGDQARAGRVHVPLTFPSVLSFPGPTSTTTKRGDACPKPVKNASNCSGVAMPSSRSQVRTALLLV